MISEKKKEDEDLFKIFETAVKSVLKLLETKKMAYSMVEIITRHPVGHGIASRTERRPDLEFMVSVFRKEILQLPSSIECISTVESCPTFEDVLDSTIYSTHFVHTITANEIFSSFLDTYFDNRIDLIFDADHFSKSFKIMMKSIKDEFVETEIFIPIEQFTMAQDFAQLVDDWSIQRVPDERLGELVAYTGYGERSPDIGRIQFALIKVLREKKEVVRNGERRQQVKSKRMDIPDLVVTAFRLLKKGFCSLSNWRVKPIDWLFDRRSRGLGFQNTNIMAPDSLRGYILLEEEIDELKDLIGLLKFLAEKEELEVPIRRFIFGIERAKGLDELIDYMIALESLYLRDNMELKFRFSLRMATFMSKSSIQHGEIFNLMKTAYNVRSKIVHGGKWKEIKKELDKGGYSLGSLLEGVEDILRDSIVRCGKLIVSGHSIEQIIKTIDVAIEQDTSLYECS
jgi:hypothetical protein